MKIGIYGGTFNPPHLGHAHVGEQAVAQLGLDRLIVIPTGTPPHKKMPADTATVQQRLEMAGIAFRNVPGVLVSDIETERDGASYTADTLIQLKKQYEDSEFFLIMGTDMFMSLDLWKNTDTIISCATPAVLARGVDDKEKIKSAAEMIFERYGIRPVIIDTLVVEVSSSELRQALPKRRGNEYLDWEVYAYIIKHRIYGAKPDFNWLRYRAYMMLSSKRIMHVAGCELEAVKLARRWGSDEDDAREAAVLHDITKKNEPEEQLILCEKYGIMSDIVEKTEYKLLHSKTGAYFAKEEFGVSEQVFSAILWHTTGKADMTLLEKIIYMADYIEQTRDFDGLDTLRRLAYEDLDKAMLRGLEMSIEDITARGITPHEKSLEAIHFLRGTLD